MASRRATKNERGGFCMLPPETCPCVLPPRRCGDALCRRTSALKVSRHGISHHPSPAPFICQAEVFSQLSSVTNALRISLPLCGTGNTTRQQLERPLGGTGTDTGRVILSTACRVSHGLSDILASSLAREQQGSWAAEGARPCAALMGVIFSSTRMLRSVFFPGIRVSSG